MAAVAKIGTTTYPTLAAAATAAVDNDTIVLLDNYTQAADEHVIFTKKVTLDLNGKTLTSFGGKKEAGGLFINTTADVVITNGVITWPGSGYGIQVCGTLTTEDCDITAQVGSGSNNGGVFDMYGTTSKVTVNSGTLTGSTDVFRLTKDENATPTVIVNGGTFAIDHDYGIFYVYKDGCKPAVTINDGTFEDIVFYFGNPVTWSDDYLLTDSCKAKFKNIYHKGDSKVYDLSDYVADGYAFVKGEDNYYTIQKAYKVEFAPTANGTVETSVTNNIVAGTEVTITATPATDYAVDTIAVTNGDAEVTVENNKFLMPAGNVTVYVTFKSTGPDLPIQPDVDLTPAGEAAAAEVAAAITGAGGDVNAWVAEVYGTDGAIPASVLNATTAANIALAVANDLPITINEPTFEVEASEATEGNVAAFEFTLKDGATDVEIKAATAKVKAMVKYTGDLATAFDTAKDTEVDVGVANGKIKAQLVKQNGVSAGFMKVEPNPAPVK